MNELCKHKHWMDSPGQEGFEAVCRDCLKHISVVEIIEILNTHHQNIARAEAAERELAALRERKQGVCRWRLEDDDSSLWAGDCGAMWTFPGGNPEENDMAYCPKCGRKLEQVEPEPPEVE